MEPFLLAHRSGEPPYSTDDSSGVLEGISIAFAVLTTVFLAIRLYSKRSTAGGYTVDDIFIVAAYVFNLGMCALGIGESPHPTAPLAGGLLTRSRRQS